MCEAEDKADSHVRCVVHVDVDCFYAQVEELRRPELRGAPLAVRQKNLVVTANYEARRRGVGKCVGVEEALRVCPELRLVRGEDLHPYRVASDKIFLLVQSFGCPVERLGMDENFVDVTSVVSSRLAAESVPAPLGRVWGGAEGKNCACGCHERLAVASHVAGEIRRRIREELGLTCSAGVAHNKLLAKLAGATHKPDDQTLLYPESAADLLASLPSVRCIPSVGVKMGDTLADLGITSVAELRRATPHHLRRRLGADMALRLLRLSVGVDDTAVKASGRPSTIGLEDSSVLSVRCEVEERFATLLGRLAALVREDGREPVALRVTLRKKDARRLGGHRESRTCQLPPGVFTNDADGLALPDAGRDKLLPLIMRLVDKLVNFSKPFHLTLVGLAFTKFRERTSGRGSILNYLMNDLSVQSVLSLRSECEAMECSVGGGTTRTSGVFGPAGDASENEEPSPKKPKRVERTPAAAAVARRRCAAPAGIGAAASPSKLRVGELRLGSRELEQVSELRLSSRDSDSMGEAAGAGVGTVLPAGVDRGVYEALPTELQQELQVTWQNSSPAPTSTSPPPPDSKPNTILRYFIPNK